MKTLCILTLFALPAVAGAELRVFACEPEWAALAAEIGGELVEVDVLVKPGQEPHTFEPTPRQVMSLGRARIFFRDRVTSAAGFSYCFFSKRHLSL